jgi:RHS repeat-associated protein
VWLGDTPVATVRLETCGLSIFYIHTDHLNTPRKISRRSTAELVWSWESDPFGTTALNENPSGLGTFSFNLRLPGQYFDQETGLNYNYARDLDPGTGRYVESDPIGLKGGINSYSYADGNPVFEFDRFGLMGFGGGGAATHASSTPVPCKQCEGTDRATFTIGGGCAMGDVQCSMALQAAGFKPPFWPHKRTYSQSCLVTLGIGAKVAEITAVDVGLKQVPTIVPVVWICRGRSCSCRPCSEQGIRMACHGRRWR